MERHYCGKSRNNGFMHSFQQKSLIYLDIETKVVFVSIYFVNVKKKKQH